MTGSTVSAHTSIEIIERLDAIARSERRNRSQVVGMALDFFVELPPAAREAWLKISTTGSTEQRELLMDKVARAIIDVQYQMAHDQVLAEMQIEQLEPLMTEDDILAAATRISQKN